MGSKLIRVSFKVKENEQIDTIIKVPKEGRSVIYGKVIGASEKPIKDAVVGLFILKNPNNPCSLCSVDNTFTDACGEFLFGPLCASKEYIIKVWYHTGILTNMVMDPIKGDMLLRRW
jgi:hypothetical protein